MTLLKRITGITIIICGLYLLAALAVPIETQSESEKDKIRIGKPPLLEYNVSGKISWQDFKPLAKNCGDLRIVIREQKGTTNTGSLRIPEYKILGYQYPTAIPNQSDCSYRVKLPEGKPVDLTVEWTGHFLQPIGSTNVWGVTVGWQNPITLKPGEKLVRDFKMKVFEIR